MLCKTYSYICSNFSNKQEIQVGISGMFNLNVVNNEMGLE